MRQPCPIKVPAAAEKPAILADSADGGAIETGNGAVEPFGPGPPGKPPRTRGAGAEETPLPPHVAFLI